MHIRFAHKVFTVPQIIRETKTNRNKIKHRWICVKKPVARCLKKHYFDLSNRQCFTFLYLIDTFLTESTPNQLLYLIFFTLKNKMPTTLWKNKIVVNKMKINFQEMSFAYSLFSYIKRNFYYFSIFLTRCSNKKVLIFMLLWRHENGVEFSSFTFYFPQNWKSVIYLVLFVILSKLLELLMLIIFFCACYLLFDAAIDSQTFFLQLFEF